MLFSREGSQGREKSSWRFRSCLFSNQSWSISRGGSTRDEVFLVVYISRVFSGRVCGVCLWLFRVEFRVSRGRASALFLFSRGCWSVVLYPLLCQRFMSNHFRPPCAFVLSGVCLLIGFCILCRGKYIHTYLVDTPFVFSTKKNEMARTWCALTTIGVGW